MSGRHLARARADIRKRLRRDLFFVSPLLLVALGFLHALVFDGWLHGQEGRMRRTDATVAEVGPVQDDGEVVIGFHYLDQDGRPREALEEYDAMPALAVGDTVAFMHGVGGREIARPVSGSDRLQSRILLGLFALTALSFAGLSGFSLRRFLWRRYLLAHGRREPGHGARIEVMRVNFRNTTQPVWRLHQKYFDPERAAWIDCSSEWQSSEPPVLGPGTELPPILVDPRHRARCWLPTGDLVPDRFWTT